MLAKCGEEEVCKVKNVDLHQYMHWQDIWSWICKSHIKKYFTVILIQMQFEKNQLRKQMADSVFLRHFITLIVNSFELTPGTLVNDMCTYWSQPAGYWCLSHKLRRAWLPRAAFGINPGELTLLCGSTGWRIIMRTLSPCLALAYGPETKWLFLTFWLMTLAHQHILFSNTHQLV